MTIQIGSVVCDSNCLIQTAWWTFVIMVYSGGIIWLLKLTFGEDNDSER